MSVTTEMKYSPVNGLGSGSGSGLAAAAAASIASNNSTNNSPSCDNNSPPPTVSPCMQLKPSASYSSTSEMANHHQHHESIHGRINVEQQACWYRLSFRKVCEFCLAMPLIGLLLCFVIACLFQFGDIQETACRVRNFIPSLSAVTGISPGRYLWRVCIAFHLGPRLLIVLTYYHFLMAFAKKLKSSQAAERLTKLLGYCFYLQIMEIIGLCLISFVHNREHYPTHQKGFIIYLGSSHLSYFLTLRIYDVIWPLLNENLIWSYRRKVAIFLASFAFLFIMVYYYYRHFIHCDQFAFSKFATAEYFVAVTNMAFYWTLTHDLSTEEVVVIRPPTPSSCPPQPPPTTANSVRGTSPSKHPLQNCSIEKKDPQDNSGIHPTEEELSSNFTLGSNVTNNNIGQLSSDGSNCRLRRTAQATTSNGKLSRRGSDSDSSYQ